MHPQDGRVVSNFIIQALKDEDITVYGDGTQTRDMCYVDNIVHANILAANSEKKFMGNCYNICNGKSVSNLEILKELKHRFGDRVKIKNAPKE